MVDNAKLLKMATYIYNSGYMNGHNDTVEGVFTHVHRQDMDSYQEDVVKELIINKKIQELKPTIPHCPVCCAEMVFMMPLPGSYMFDIYTCPNNCKGKQSAIVVK